MSLESKPCPGCRSWDPNLHPPWCKSQTLEQKARSGERYHEFWLQEMRKFSEMVRQLHGPNAHSDQFRLRSLITYWQGKFSLLKQENNALRKQIRKQPSPSEAIFAFAAWLTTRKEELRIGSENECSQVVDLLNQFCDGQKWDPPRDRYAHLIKPYPSDGE